MKDEKRATDWRRIWEDRREDILRLDGLGDWRTSLPQEAVAILEEAQALAAVADPAVHAVAPVDVLIARVNALPETLPFRLHRPVCSGLSMLRIAAQKLLSPEPAPAAAAGRWGRLGRLDWFLVVGDDVEIVELVAGCAAALRGGPEVRAASTRKAAVEGLRRQGRGLVVTGLVLPASVTKPGPFGLAVAREARRRRHAVVLVTAARDYAAYRSQLATAGLTGHDVIDKTRPDFAVRFLGRVRELAEPPPLRLSFLESGGHVVRIGNVEVPNLDVGEELMLRQLRRDWRTAASIAAWCGDETIRPPGSEWVAPVISRLRHKLSKALVAADSDRAQPDVIQSERLAGYRLAPWVQPDEDEWEACGAPPVLPPVLVVEDEPDWAQWTVGLLEELRWPASVASTLDEARDALTGEPVLVMVADLGLCRAPGGLADPEAGLALIEEAAARHPELRVVVLSAFGHRDTLRARLFEAGVRTVDVIDKAFGPNECWSALQASLQRATDEAWRGVRRGAERSPVHRVVRLERARIEVDGVDIALTTLEREVLDVLFSHANRPVTAEALLEACFSGGDQARDNPPLNRLQLVVSRLRRKIDCRVGHKGTGKAMIRTPHRRTASTYQLYGLITDPTRVRTWR